MQIKVKALGHSVLMASKQGLLSYPGPGG